MNKSLLFFSVLCLAASFAGCSENDHSTNNSNQRCHITGDCGNEPGGTTPGGTTPGGTTPGGTTPGGTTPGGTTPEGEQQKLIPQFTFTLNYGGYLGFLTVERWEALLPGLSSNDLGKGEIVVMLCNEDDPTCKAPVMARAVLPEEGWDPEKHPIQKYYGPNINLYNLPGGTYNMMIFTDVPVTARNGLSWKDTLPMCTKGVDDWGCLVSEADLMMVSNDELATYETSSNKRVWGNYPQPKSIKVTITAQDECKDATCTENLGTVMLAHYHDRNISIQPRPEDGYIVVATAGGVRIVDLSTFKVLEAYDPEHVDYGMVDGSNKPVTDVPCGLVDGKDGKTVWILYSRGGDSKRNNYAVPFDVQQKKQIGNKRVEIKTSAAKADFCRGIIDDQGHMLVWSREQNDPAIKGSRVAYIPDLGDVINDNADIVTDSDASSDIQYLDRTESLVAWHNTMYSIQGNLDATGKHQDSNGDGICDGNEDQCIFKTRLGGERIEAITEKGNASTFIDNGPYFDTVDSKSCEVENYFTNVPALTLVEKSKSEAWLIASKCMSVSAWKLTYNDADGSVSEEPMALGNRPGIDFIDTSTYGVFIHDWALSPDGRRLYGMPSGKSTTMLYHKLGEEKRVVTSNRILGLVLDVSGDKPIVAADPQFNRNIDDYEGNKDGKGIPSPAVDPGIDIQQHWYTQYFNTLTDNLEGQMTTFRPKRPLIVASENMLWLIRVGNAAKLAGKDGTTTLGHQRDIAAYDLKEARSILWPHHNETFYHPYMGATDESRPSGFPLDQVHYDTVNTVGIVYMPKKK